MSRRRIREHENPKLPPQSNRVTAPPRVYIRQQILDCLLQPTRCFSTSRMATTWHHPLDTLERPARADGGAGRTAAEFRVTWQGLTEGLMDQITDPTKLAREPLNDPAARPRRRTWRTAAVGAVAVPALVPA